MGRARQDQIDHEGKVQHAIGLCIEIGAIEECEAHDGEYIDTMEYLDPEELTNKIIEETRDALEFFDGREEMGECVRDAMASAGEECGYCARNRDK